jgi:signal transduction histidine kinase
MDQEARSFAVRLAAISLALSGALVVGGYVYLSDQQAKARATARRELSTIADLKLRQINNWRNERLSDGRFFARARFVAQDVHRLLDQPQLEAPRSAIEDWLKLLKGGDRYYAAVVFDGRLERRLALPDTADEPRSSVRALLAEAARSRDVVMSDFNQDLTNGLVHLDMLVPVFEDADRAQGPPIGAVLLKIDARQFLFPLLRLWPTPSRTAETLLVRREGDDALFLNDLRHGNHTAMSLRLPLSTPTLPAAEVVRGQTNVVEGVDYRGVPVVAAGRSVEGTGWGLIAKVDRDEIYAPLRRETLAVGLVVGSLLAATALLVALMWRQRTAQLLLKANADLERRVEERTAQLRQSIGELEAFSYSLSHDLRAPLRAVSNFTTLVLEENRAKLGKDALLLDNAVRAARRMDQLILDVLTLSRISRQELQTGKVNLDSLVRQVILERPEFHAPKAEVRIESPLPAVRGHEASLTQCLTNLLSNAVKFVPRGVTPQVRIYAETRGGKLRLWVADNGIGIPPQAREKIFGIFHRLHSPAEYEGTGIGLAIVRKAVERMGGCVGVESEEGRGSRFWIELEQAS